MFRRSILVAVFGVATAGCIGGNDDTDQTDGQENLTDEDHLLLLESAVDPEVEEVSRRDDTVNFEYQVSSNARDDILREIEAIAREFAGRVADGLDVARFEATGYDGEQPAYEWYVDAEWAREYNSGDMSIDAFHGNVQDTVEEVE